MKVFSTEEITEAKTFLKTAMNDSAADEGFFRDPTRSSDLDYVAFAAILMDEDGMDGTDIAWRGQATFLSFKSEGAEFAANYARIH